MITCFAKHSQSSQGLSCCHSNFLQKTWTQCCW